MNTKLVTVWCVAATLITACAGNIPFLSTSTPTPTNTPTPTIAPTPTLTPRPTWTPTPTRIPRPGIDIPVEFGGNLVIKFDRLKITDYYYNPDIFDQDFKIHPGVGQTWLVIEGEYSGDVTSGGLGNIDVVHQLQAGHSFYVSSPKSPRDSAFTGEYSGPAKHLFAQLFIIDTGNHGPFMLVDKVHGWVVDLSSLPIGQ